MKHTAETPVIVMLAVLALAGCNEDRMAVETSSTSSSAEGKTAPLPRSPGKLSAPVTFEYSIAGNPVVGQAVGINVEVSSPLQDRPITLHYRMSEAGSMTFPESQVASAVLAPLANTEVRRRQLTVVPQREGRVFLVVSAEIETEGGTMMKSMSIPIQVGRAPAAPTANGEVVEGTDGELGVSMPANPQ